MRITVGADRCVCPEFGIKQFAKRELFPGGVRANTWVRPYGLEAPTRDRGPIPGFELTIHRPHDDINATQDRHNIGHLHSLQQVGQNLQVIEIRGADLKPPGEDIVVPHNKHP